MTTATAKIVDAFNKAINLDEDYSNREMLKILSDAYKANKEVVPKKPKDDAEPAKKKGRPAKVRLDKNGNPKEKKAPSEYNLYVKAQYHNIKESHPDWDVKEIMKEIAINWKASKKPESDVDVDNI